MDEDQGISSSLPPFLAKTYEMVDDLSTDAIVSWSSSDKSFIVWNPPEFSRDLLPKFFKHNNFSSFIRQLNTYGFRKVDPEQWEFANEDFIRGQPHLMKNIHRRKPVHSHSLQNIHGQRLNPLTDAERQSYKDDIERLKRDKDALILRLQTHEHERQVQIQALKEKMQQMEKRQQTMVSYVARVLQKPWLPLNLLPPSEGHERKRRLPRTDCFNDEVCIEDDQPATSQAREDVDGSSVVLFNKDRFEQLESSLTFWEDIVRGQNNLSLEFDESTSCAESQAISCGQLNTELRPKSPVIDMNSELRPKSPVIDMNSEPSAAGPTEQVTKQEQAVETVPAPATGANDVFWEQFLTENPGSNDNQEVQSERKDSGGKRDEIKPNDLGKVWWNMSNVNNLAEQMGQLTPAERT